MKKFIFFIFAICVYGPSFGACNHIYGPVPSDNKYLESRFSFGKPAYLQCGGSATNNAQCAQNNIVVGKDGYLYRCGDNIWTKLNDNDKELPPCNSNIRGDLVGLDPTYMGNNKESEYIYLVKAHSDTEKTFYRCKYPRKDENDTRDKCILTCGDYYSGICNRDHAKDIIVKIVDKDDKAINSASIIYPKLTAPNNSINIITQQKENGNYALCLNDANKELEVKISAPDHTPVTKTVRQLLDKKNQTITLQKTSSNNSNRSTTSLPAPATDKNFIMNTSDKLIITCESKSTLQCTLPDNHNLTPLRDCNDLRNDLITDTKVLYIDRQTFDRCEGKIGTSVDKSKCPAIQRAFIGDSAYVLFCINNPNIQLQFTNDPTDGWSYAHKQCVGSWGEWKNGECDCSALDGAENVDNECMCTKNENQKYYNKLWSGCETLKDGVYQAGTKTKILGFWEDLSKIDRANSCSPSGGTWSGTEGNECDCRAPHMELDPSGYFCNCKEGYDYTDPMAKSNGCSPKSEINYDSDDISTEFQSSEQVAPTGTEEYECTKSGGDKYENGKCICDADKHLEEYNPENANEYSICKCMYGYIRKGAELDTDGKTVLSYPDGAECEYAGTETVEKVFDSAAWRRDTENAYKHERDNAQSWANKGITAGSTLLTGEGAMKAAQALAEQRADERAEREMAAYITTMKCEYGGGQQVNLGAEETLPFGELSTYYTEYKQLADKLKATKTALNLRPGIESEVLYDRAETGLYQYANAERQSGGFTSLSRALMNPEGADAEQWNAQKAEVAQNLQTGTLLTAGGLVVGAAGNYLVNRNHKKEYQELEKKFKEIEEKLLIEYPEVFSIREDKPVIEIIEEETEEVPIPEQSVAPKRITLDNLTAKSGAFRSGYASLTDEGKKGVADAMQLITEQLDAYEIKAIKITATGHSDPEKIDSRYIARITNNYKQVVKQEYFSDMFDRIAENEQLSTARAQAVVTALLDKIKMNNPSLPWPTYFANGFDGTECKQPKPKYAECRYVDITIELDVIEKQN